MQYLHTNIDCSYLYSYLHIRPPPGVYIQLGSKKEPHSARNNIHKPTLNFWDVGWNFDYDTEKKTNKQNEVSY